MFEKLNKIQVQNIACIIIICASFALALLSMFFQMPQGSEVLINKVTDIALVGVVGFLFTRNKTQA